MPSSLKLQPQIYSLAIDLIHVSPYQARQYFDPQALQELADSIAENGLLQPIVVEQKAQNHYQLIAGERRWRAAQKLGLETIPALIKHLGAATETAILGLIENLQREHLNPLETAQGLSQLYNELNLTQSQIARRLGKPRLYVTHHLALLRLPKTVQNFLARQQLSLGHAKVLAPFPAAQQTALAQKCVQQQLSVRQLEQLVRHKPSSNTKDTQDSLAFLEQSIASHLGNPVHIHYNQKTKAGSLEIKFHNLDEFDGLLDTLGIPKTD